MENNNKSWLFGREKNAKTFSEICESIYGYAWQSELHERLVNPETGKNVNLRTIQRWAAGQYPVPNVIWEKLPGMAREVSGDIGQLAADLERFVSSAPP